MAGLTPGQGRERVEVHQQDLGGASSGEGLQQPGAHHGGLAEPSELDGLRTVGEDHGLVARQAKQLDVAEHAGQVGVADVVAFVGLADGPADAALGDTVEPGVAVGQRQPSLVVEGRGGFDPVVVHVTVEVADHPLGSGDRARVQSTVIVLGSTCGLRPPFLQKCAEFQHEAPELGRVGNQGGLVETAVDGECGEASRVHSRGRHR